MYKLDKKVYELRLTYKRGTIAKFESRKTLEKVIDVYVGTGIGSKINKSARWIELVQVNTTANTSVSCTKIQKECLAIKFLLVTER